MNRITFLFVGILFPLLMTSMSLAAENINLQNGKKDLTPVKTFKYDKSQIDKVNLEVLKFTELPKEKTYPRDQRVPVNIKGNSAPYSVKELDSNSEYLGPGASGGGQGVLMNDGTYRFLDIIPDTELQNIRALPKNYFNYGRCVNYPFYTIPSFQFPLKSIEALLKKANIPAKAILDAGARLEKNTVFSSAAGLFVAQDSSRIPKDQQINIGVNTGKYLIVFEPVFRKLSEQDKEAFFLHEILRQYVYLFNRPLKIGMSLREIEKTVSLLYNNGNTQEINTLMKTDNKSYQVYEEQRQWIDVSNYVFENISYPYDYSQLKQNLAILSNASLKTSSDFSILLSMKSYDELLDMLQDVTQRSHVLDTIRQDKEFAEQSKNDAEFSIVYYKINALQSNLNLHMALRFNQALESNNLNLESALSDIRQILYGNTAVLDSKKDKKTLIEEGILLPPVIFHRKDGKVWNIHGKQWTSPANPACWGSTF